jgi:hypothetical protein
VFCHTINIQATLDSITNTNLKSEFFAYTVMMLRCYPLADVGLICRPRRIFISPHRATPNRNNHRPHSWHYHILGTSLPAYYLSIDALASICKVMLEIILIFSIEQRNLHRWFSGKISRCHCILRESLQDQCRLAPGSIPGRCN